MRPVTSLEQVASLARPLARADSRLMTVPDPLAGLFPESGIRRGTTVAVGPLAGGCSLACALAASVTATHGWVAAVGLSSLGLVAAADAGVDLARLALVRDPGDQWSSVVAALVDGFELLLLRPPARTRVGDARRIAARVRERGSVLVLVDAAWPESPDLVLTVEGVGWQGLGQGWGRLSERQVEVVAGGRRVGGRPRRAQVCLPASDGRLIGRDETGGWEAVPGRDHPVGRLRAGDPSAPVGRLGAGDPSAPVGVDVVGAAG